MKISKREQIFALINEGEQTKETLMEAVDVNIAGLSSQFTYLRLQGRYPVLEESGFYKFVDEDEWNTIKASAQANRAPAAPKKSPEERLEALEKRYAKLEAAYEKRNEADSSTINDLRLDKARVELAICSYELAQVQEELAE